MQAGLLAVIQKLTNYTSSNTSLADYRFLQRGYDKVVVLRPGSFTRERTEFGGGKENTWNVIIELFIKYQDDAQAQNAIRDERQDIINKVDEYPKLDGTNGVLIADIIGGAEPVPVFDASGGGPHFIMAEMTCRIVEIITVTETE